MVSVHILISVWPAGWDFWGAPFGFGDGECAPGGSAVANIMGVFHFNDERHFFCGLV